jgi:hypothetical protein
MLHSSEMSGTNTLVNLLAHTAAQHDAAEEVALIQGRIDYKRAQLAKKVALEASAKSARAASTQKRMAAELLEKSEVAEEAADMAHDALKSIAVPVPDVLLKRARDDAAADERAAKRRKTTAEAEEAARAAGAVPPPVGSWWERSTSYAASLTFGGVGAWFTFG